MKKELLLIILLQIFIFSGFAQDKTTKAESTVIIQSYVEPVDPTEPCDNCQTDYQWNRDWDKDGYGDPNDYVFSPTKPNGYVANQQDCDDTDPSIKTADTVWYRDADLDGRGAINGSTTKACTQPVGFAATNDDLDDNNKLITNITPQTFYFDYDGDTFGDPNVSIYASVKPDKYVTNKLDYDDRTAIITNIPPIFYYWDNDGDGYGNSANTAYIISASPGFQLPKYVDKIGDCNDNAASLNPGTKWYADLDGDDLGDPLNFIQQCTRPGSNYVIDYSDNCPLVYGTGSDCSNIPIPDTNYIISTTYKKETAQVFVNPTPNQAQTNITYFDGLGRPIQQINNQYSAKGKDIITHIDYDDLGRQTKEFLPFASNQTSLNFMLPSILEFELTKQYKTNHGSANDNPFSEKQLESSPLNRVLKQASPGNDWKSGSGHEIKMEYQSNIAGELIYYYATTAWNSTLGLYTTILNSGIYDPNVLYKTITYDENTAATPSEINGSTVEFKNKEGQVVLKRTYGTVESGTANEKHDTYYVYDIYGNLTYVIPPKAVDLLGTTSAQADLTSTVQLTSASAALHLTASNSIRLLPGFHAQAGSTFSAVIDGNKAVLDNLCYQYKYDYRNRLVEKKLPGKQWEFILYDKLDRVVATGPANSPFSDITTPGWSVTKYDAFNRPVITGWLPATVTTATRKTLQDAQNALTSNFNETKIATPTNTIIPATTGVKFRYDNAAWPTTGYHVMSVSYYDDYNFPDAPATIPTTIATNTAGLSQAVYYNATTKPIGLATGSWIRVPDLSTNYKYEQTYSLYDAKARPVRSYTQNFLGGFTCTDSKLNDFSGQLQYTITTHSRLATDPVLKTTETFTYSAQDRLISQTHQIGTATAETLFTNTYDELGQMVSKKVGGSTQKIDYTYNIRGWLTGINDVDALAKTGDPKDLFAFKINYNTTTTTGVKALYNGNIAETYWSSASEATPVIRGYGYI
jgi:hypothetical protein